MKFLSLSKNLLIHSILLFLCAMLSTRVMTDDIQHSNNMRIWAAMMWDCCKCRRFWQQLKQVSFPFVRLFIDANNKHAQLKIERDFFCSFFSFLLFSFNHASSGMLLCLLFSLLTASTCVCSFKTMKKFSRHLTLSWKQPKIRNRKILLRPSQHIDMTVDTWR